MDFLFNIQVKRRIRHLKSHFLPDELSRLEEVINKEIAIGFDTIMTAVLKHDTRYSQAALESLSQHTTNNPDYLTLAEYFRECGANPVRSSLFKRVEEPDKIYVPTAMADVTLEIVEHMEARINREYDAYDSWLLKCAQNAADAIGPLVAMFLNLFSKNGDYWIIASDREGTKYEFEAERALRLQGLHASRNQIANRYISTYFLLREAMAVEMFAKYGLPIEVMDAYLRPKIKDKDLRQAS